MSRSAPLMVYEVKPLRETSPYSEIVSYGDHGVCVCGLYKGEFTTPDGKVHKPGDPCLYHFPKAPSGSVSFADEPGRVSFVEKEAGSVSLAEEVRSIRREPGFWSGLLGCYIGMGYTALACGTIFWHGFRNGFKDGRRLYCRICR